MTRDASAPPLLAVDGLVKHFVAKRNLLGRPVSFVRAVDGVSFSVAAGETLAIVGESGCGKSTVGRLALRLIEPTSGRVMFDGEDIVSLSAQRLRQFRSKAQLIFQDPYASLNPRMTIGATLAEPLFLHTAMSDGDRKNRVAELLATVGQRRLLVRVNPCGYWAMPRRRLPSHKLKLGFLLAVEFGFPMSRKSVMASVRSLRLPNSMANKW